MGTRTTWRYLSITLGVAAVVGGGAGAVCAQDSMAPTTTAPLATTTVTTPGPTTAQITAARELAARLEEEAYAANPRLRQVERMRGETRAQWDGATAEQSRAAGEVQRLSQQFRHAGNDYQVMIARWGMVEEIEMLKDEVTADVLRHYVTRSAEQVRSRAEYMRRTGEAVDEGDKDAFWQAYRRWLVAHEGQVRAAPERLATPGQAAGAFPQWVKDRAKVDGALLRRADALEAYLADHLPRELRRARHDADRLESNARLLRQREKWLRRREQ